MNEDLKELRMEIKELKQKQNELEKELIKVKNMANSNAEDIKELKEDLFIQYKETKEAITDISKKIDSLLIKEELLKEFNLKKNTKDESIKDKNIINTLISNNNFVLNKLLYIVFVIIMFLIGANIQDIIKIFK